MRNQIKEDSLFRENWAKESSEIDALLTKVAGLTEEMLKGGTLVGADLVDKTQKVENLVEEVNFHPITIHYTITTHKKNTKPCQVYPPNSSDS